MVVPLSVSGDYIYLWAIASVSLQFYPHQLSQKHLSYVIRPCFFHQIFSNDKTALVVNFSLTSGDHVRHTKHVVHEHRHGQRVCGRDLMTRADPGITQDRGQNKPCS
jgi:hypothetical protein